MDAPSTIGIVGTGLIGAGFAALVSRRAPDVVIRAVEPNGSYRAAVQAQLPPVTFDHCAKDLADADIVFVCAPPGAVVGLAREVLDAGDALVVDMASTKGRIVTALSDAPRFIGGHPLAGGNAAGPFTSEPDALAAARSVLTPHAGNGESDIEWIEHFLARLGFAVVRADAHAHDQILARTSHLPHLLAYGYAGLLGSMDADERAIFASRSTRNTVHHAAANTRMWAEILDQNTDAVSAALDEMILELMELRTAFAGGRRSDLTQRLEAAATTAQTLTKGEDT